MATTKKVFIEPAWKLHSMYESLVTSPPPGYEFIVREGAIEKGIKLASRWEPSYRLLAEASRLGPISLLRSLAAKVQPRPEDACLTYAPARVVLRREPWVLDMHGDPPHVLSVTNERCSRPLWDRMTCRILASTYCRKILLRFNAHKEEFMSYFRDERLAHKLQVFYWGVPKKDFVKDYSDGKVRLFFVNSTNINTHEHFRLKGGHEVLAAFSELSRRYDNLELVVRSTMSSEVRRELANDSKVRFIDEPIPWDELEREWLSADIFVFPTRVTTAQVLYDALSYELPIVTTDVAGNPEIVEDGNTGLLVPGPKVTPIDRELVQALCQKLSILIENRELRRRMGKEARCTAEEKFSIEKRNEALKRVLDEATEGRPAEQA